MSEVRQQIERRLGDALALHQALLAHSEAIAAVAEVLVSAYGRGAKAIFFGNGGSAADAQHLAAELVGRYYHERRALPALALSVNTSSVTAIGNDYGYEAIFARQIEAFGTKGDVAIGISTSGRSPNVLAAVRVAKAQGLVTVGLTGQHGGPLGDEVDHLIAVPSTDTPRIQEAHILIGHLWCEAIERSVSGDRA
ncbi:MAG: D-sedoheptulose 7-phosphate isomerase [Myxococcota bacterium]